jgi:hypothetical protein
MKREREKEEPKTRIGALKSNCGAATIGALRSYYGSQFAKGCSSDETLTDALHKLDEPLLTRLVGAYESGRLELLCRDGIRLNPTAKGSTSA